MLHKDCYDNDPVVTGLHCKPHVADDVQKVHLLTQTLRTLQTLQTGIFPDHLGRYLTVDDGMFDQSARLSWNDFRCHVELAPLARSAMLS